jgi:beta-lactamase class A
LTALPSATSVATLAPPQSEAGGAEPGDQGGSKPYPNELAAQIEAITAQAGGSWHIVIREAGGALLYSQRAGERIHIASVVKLPIALLVFERLAAQGVAEQELAAYLQARGVGGRTYQQLLEAMLVKSEEDATEILLASLGEGFDYRKALAAWELGAPLDLEARRFTAEGLANLYEKLYAGELLSPTARQLLWGYLSAYTPNDDGRIGALRADLPPGWQIYNKRGSLTNPYVVADSGLIAGPGGRAYIVIVFAYQGDPPTTYEQLDQAIGALARAFWQAVEQ